MSFGIIDANSNLKLVKIMNGKGCLKYGKNLFKVIQVKKTYGGRTVVNGVGISLEEGEIVGLLGPNGAGKTACFYMMVAWLKPMRGCLFR